MASKRDDGTAQRKRKGFSNTVYGLQFTVHDYSPINPGTLPS